MTTGTTRTLIAILIFGSYSQAVYAGPCAADIAELGRKLSETSSLGPATTGALTGSGPGTVEAQTTGATPTKAGTSADQKVGGTAGTKELNAAVGQVATSADDVRRQQQGLPTAAQVAAQGSNNTVETTPTQASSPKPDERLSQAKMELETAKGLDQANDKACADAVDRTRRSMGS